MLSGAGADSGQALAQADPRGIRSFEHVVIERAGHPATADAGQSELIRLLGEKIHHLERVPQPRRPVLQRCGDLQTRDHARDAVEATAPCDRVTVRADHDRARQRLGARQTTDQIARGVDRCQQPELAHPAGKPLPSLGVALGKRPPRPGLLRICQLC